MSNIQRLPLLVLGFILASCAGIDDNHDRRRDRDVGPPTVSLRADRNADRIVPAAEEYLERAGYEITRGRWSDYELELELDDGPVNAIVTMKLTHHGRTVAEAEGRSGGPRIIFNRTAVIQEAFDECAHRLDRDLPPADRRRW